MARRVLAAAVLLLVFCAYQADAWCAIVVGESPAFGAKCGAMFSQRDRDTTWHMKKLNVYHDGSCVTGLKAQWGYKSGDAQLMGSETGQQKDLVMGDSEYISSVEIRVGSKCIEFLKFTTDKGKSLVVGSGSGQLVPKPRSDAYVFGFKGYAAGLCAFGLGQLQFIWAIEDCNPKAPASVAVQPVPRLIPVPYNVTFYKNISVPVPVPVYVPTPVNVTVKIPVPVPVYVNVTREVPTPVYVNVTREVPTPVPVPTPVNVTREVPTPVPVPVPTPVNVTVEVPTPVPVPVPVPVPTPVPVPAQPPAAPVPKPDMPPPSPEPATPPPAPKPVTPPPAPEPVTPPPVPVASLCDEDEDLMVFTASSSLACVLSSAGSKMGTLHVIAPSSKFAGYAGTICFDMGCKVEASAPAPALSAGKGYAGGVLYRGMYTSELEYEHGRKLSSASFLPGLGKGKGHSFAVPAPAPTPAPAPPRLVYVPVSLPAPAPVLKAKCSFAICITPQPPQLPLSYGKGTTLAAGSFSLEEEDDR